MTITVSRHAVTRRDTPHEAFTEIFPHDRHEQTRRVE